jgi:hypothetical protein
MSDDAETTADDSAQDQSGEKTFTQTQLDKILANRLPEYEGLKAKAAQLDSLTESAKTAAEQEADWKAKAEAAESELAWSATLLMRQEIAASKGLDSRMWSRIKGETKEEIEADIGELQGFTVTTKQRPSSLKSGASAEAATTAKERAAQALRGIRER